MIKAIRDEMKGGLSMIGLMAGVGWGMWLLLTVIFSLVLHFSSGYSEWADIGSIVALVMVLFLGWITTMVMFSFGFQMAVTMGRTRRKYAVSALCANMLQLLAGLAAVYPTMWASLLVKRVFFPALPFEGGTWQASSPTYFMYHRHLGLTLGIGLLLVLVGMALGALMMRYGRVAFWIMWGICVFGGAGVGLISRLVESSPRLTAVLAACGTWVRNMPGLALALAWALVMVILSGIGWLLVRKASVR